MKFCCRFDNHQKSENIREVKVLKEVRQGAYGVQVSLVVRSENQENEMHRVQGL